MSGVVIGEEDGWPVIGANVMVKGTSTGTVTDLDGNFSLTVPAGATIAISYMGYETYEQKLTADNQTLNVSLKSDALMLDEVVAIGYGVMKKATSRVPLHRSRPTNCKRPRLRGLTKPCKAAPPV